MPELPEVELTCRVLKKDGIIGQKIIAFERTNLNPPQRTQSSMHPAHHSTHKYWTSMPDTQQLRTHLLYRTITDLRRRGKYIVFVLGQSYMLVHLGMSGRLWSVPAKDVRSGYERLLCRLSNGNEVRFHDPRRFGRVQLVSTLADIEGRCGVEPLHTPLSITSSRGHLSLKWLITEMHQRKRMLQAMLLDQNIIVGIGNIYCNEALWYARLHPQQQCNTLTASQIMALYKAIKIVLMKGIRNGGTRLGDGAANFQLPNRRGDNTEHLCVYRRARLPCMNCDTLIVRISMAGRGTYFCPQCQPLR